MGQEFNNALNDCLERVSQGENLQKCLSDYPQYREELDPLLQVGVSTMKFAETMTPPKQSKERNFQSFMQAVQTAQTEPRKKPWYSFSLLTLAKPIAISLVAVVVLAMGAGVTTAASSDAVPGEYLYWVKTTRENVQLRLNRSDASKAQTHADLANVRGEEVRKLVSKGRYTAANEVMKRLNRHLQSSAVHVGIDVTVNHQEMPQRPPSRFRGRNVDQLRASLEQNSHVMRIELNKMVSELTPEQKQQLQQFMRRSELYYRVLVDAMTESGNNGHLPFIRIMPPQKARQR